MTFEVEAYDFTSQGFRGVPGKPPGFDDGSRHRHWFSRDG